MQIHIKSERNSTFLHTLTCILNHTHAQIYITYINMLTDPVGGGGGYHVLTHTCTLCNTYKIQDGEGGRKGYLSCAHAQVCIHAYTHRCVCVCGGGGSEGEGGGSRTGEGCGLFSVCGGGGVHFISVVTAVLWTGGISVFGTHSSVF